MSNPVDSIPNIEISFTGKPSEEIKALNAQIKELGRLIDGELRKLDSLDAKVVKNLRRTRAFLQIADGGAQLQTAFTKASNIRQERVPFMLATNENQQARMRRSFSEGIRSQLFNDVYSRPLATLNKATKTFIEEMVKSGEAKLVKEALTARRASEAFNGANSRALKALDSQITYLKDYEALLKKKAADLREEERKNKTTSDQARRKAEKEAERVQRENEREAKRVQRENEREAKRRNTVRYQMAEMQDMAYAPYLQSPQMRAVLEGNARSRTNRALTLGSRQQDIEALLWVGMDRLAGPNRMRHYDPNKIYNGGDRVQTALSSLGLHRDALTQAMPRYAQGSDTRLAIQRALEALVVEEKQLRTLLAKQVSGSMTQDSTLKALNQQLKEANRKEKGAGYEAGLKTFLGFNPENFAQMTPEAKQSFKKGLRDTKRWLDQTAREALESGNTQEYLNITRKWAQLENTSVAIRNMEQGSNRAQARTAQEKNRLDTLKAATYRETGLEPQIKAAKTLADLKIQQVKISDDLSRASQLYRAASKQGDQEQIARAERLLRIYAQERLALMERQKLLQPRTGAAERFAQLNTSQGRAGLFATQSVLRENYAIQNVVTGSLSGAYTFIRDFEAALKQTQAISQASTAQVERLKTAIIEVSDASRFSAIQLAEASTILAQAGFSIGEVEKALSGVATLATATGSSLQDSVDIATSVLGAFQLSASSMPDIVNQITQAMNLSKLDVPKFMLAVQYAGNTAAEMGMSFRETLADIATVANTGIRSGSTMGTGMRQLLADLTAPTAKFKAILKDLGLTLSDVDVRVYGLAGVLKNLKEAGFSGADALESFELRAANFYTALSNNLDGYNQLYVALDDNTAAMRAQEVQMDSLAAQSDRMSNQFKILADTIGGETATALTGVFRTIANLTAWLNDQTQESIAGSVIKFSLLTLTIAGVSIAIVRTISMLSGLTLIMRVAQAQALKNAASLGVATASTNAFTGAIARNTAAMVAWNSVMTFSRAHPILVALTVGAALATAFTLANNSLGSSLEQNKKTLDRQIGTYKELDDAIKTNQSSLSEVENKIMSLTSRSESLRDNQSDLAVEFVEVRKKALELGVSLSTQVEMSVESLRKSWEELRLEMSKKILIDVEMKGQALQQQQATTRQVYNQTTLNQGYATEGLFAGATLAANQGFNPVQQITRSEEILNKYMKSPLKGLPQSRMLAAPRAIMAAGNARRLYEAAIAAGMDPAKGEQMVAALLTTQRYLTADVERMSPKELEEMNKELNASYLKANALLMELETLLKRESTSPTRTAAERKDFAKIAAQMQDNLFRKSPKEDDKDAPESLAMRYMAMQSIVGQTNVNKLQQSDLARARAGKLYAEGKGIFQENYFTSKAQALSTEQINTLAKSQAKWMPLVEQIAEEEGVDPYLLMAMLHAESRGNPNAISPVGAGGLMQLMPDTAKQYGLSDKDRFNPEKSIRAGAKHLRYLEKHSATGGQVSNMVMAYNMGEGALGNRRAQAQKAGVDIMSLIPAETRGYLPEVASYYAALSSQTIPRGGAQIIQEAAYNNPELDKINRKLADLSLGRETTKRRLTEAEAKNDQAMVTELVQLLAEFGKQAQLLQESRNQLLVSAKEQASTEREKAAVEAEIIKYQKEAQIQRENSKLDEIDPAYRLNEYQAQLNKVIDARKLAVLQDLDLEKLKAGESDISTDALILKAQKARQITAKAQIDLDRIEREGEKMRLEAIKKFEAKQLEILLESLKNQHDAIKRSHEEAMRMLEERTKATEALLKKEEESRTLMVDMLRTARSNMDKTGRSENYNDADRDRIDTLLSKVDQDINDRLERVRLEETLKTTDQAITELEDMEADRLAKLMDTEYSMETALKKAGGDINDKVYQALLDRANTLKDQMTAYSTKLKELEVTKEGLERQANLLGAGDLIDEYRLLSNSEEDTRKKQGVAARKQALFQDMADTRAKSSTESGIYLYLKGKADEYRNAVDTYGNDIAKIIERKQQIEQELALKGFSKDAIPELLKPKAGITERLADHYRLQTKDAFGDEAMFQDALAVTESLKSGFEGLTSSLMQSTDGVEDFFRALIGRSKEGKAAWREFGLSIVETALKTVTNRMVNQFINMLLGDSGSGKKGEAASPNFLQVGLSALGSLFGFGGGDASPKKMATGGKVTGGVPNKDSVPILAMPNEWVMPTSTTKVLGDGFMEGLRTNPAATMAKVAGLGAMSSGKASTTNVYVVSPDKVPSGLTDEDVVVTVSRDLSNGGPIYQMIKQIKT